mmetsp:Transcript_23492/g.32150  ORF Transcript_23492/g.32150 Transcript_23492/m.32150 type:complete len:323 (+) Transcript_23492:172-1140(+)
MDPGTFDTLRLMKLRDMGINRISMGVQSFNDTILKSCGRAHSANDVFAALQCLNEAHIDSYSIDLISSLPGMDLELWSNTLHMAGSLGPPHLSVYDLQIEEKTAFGRWYSPGVFPLPSEESSAQMYRMAVEILTQCYGYEHYEVSNYAKPGKRSRHNQKYWKNVPFWGIGMGAASFIDGVRFTRPSTYSEYSEWVKNLSDAQNITDDVSNEDIKGDEELDRDSLLDVVMLSLRTADGLNLTALPVDIRTKVIHSLLPFASPRPQTVSSSEGPLVQFFSEEMKLTAPLLEVQLKDAIRVRLTDPDGFLLSNDIISSVFAALMP